MRIAECESETWKAAELELDLRWSRGRKRDLFQCVRFEGGQGQTEFGFGSDLEFFTRKSNILVRVTLRHMFY